MNNGLLGKSWVRLMLIKVKVTEKIQGHNK